MDIKSYLKVSGANLAFLLAGVLIGPPIVNTGRHLFDPVQAQSKENPDKPAAKMPATPVPAEDPNVEYVTPAIGLGGPVVTNTLLANRIACDRLQVNGFDLLKLNDAILTALLRKGLLTATDVSALVASGKADRPLRLKPEAPTPAVPPK